VGRRNGDLAVLLKLRGARGDEELVAEILKRPHLAAVVWKSEDILDLHDEMGETY
jgi:hypothetical protein